MKKILVAGGGGYIGSRLTAELVAAGHAVSVVDLFWFGRHLAPGIDIIEKDIFHLKPEDLQGFDVVIFIAGLSNDPMAEFSPALNFISNGACPTYLAYIAKLAHVRRFICGSSCSVYGLADTDMVTEEEKPNTQFPYGISKLSGEQGTLQIADADFSVIALRQGTVSGASPRMRFDLMLNTMYMRAATEKKIVVNNPRIWRPMLALTDAIEAYKKAIEAPATLSGVFNVASANTTVGDAAKEVQAYFKEKYGIDVVVEENAVPDKRNYRVSNEKAKEVLGITFTGSVRSVLDDLDQHVGIGYDFKNPNGYNIEIFKKLPKTFTLE